MASSGRRNWLGSIHIHKRRLAQCGGRSTQRLLERPPLQRYEYAPPADWLSLRSSNGSLNELHHALVPFLPVH